MLTTTTVVSFPWSLFLNKHMIILLPLMLYCKPTRRKRSSIWKAHFDTLWGYKVTTVKKESVDYLPLQKLRTDWVFLPRRSQKAMHECFEQSIINNFTNTIVFVQYMWRFPIPINYAIEKFIVRITARFAPANDCVLFVLLKPVFVALPSGTVWADVPSPFVVSGVANMKYDSKYWL